MIPIILFTTEDALTKFTKDNGLELSIKKWESVCEGLQKIFNMVNARCGLCLQYPTCQTCPLPAVENAICGDDKSSYTIAREALDTALIDAYNMLDVLKAIRKKEVLG
jgi:hypothetical protein